MAKETIASDIESQLVTTGQNQSAAAKLLEAYGVPFVEMGKLIEESKTITVTSEDDTEGMAKAKSIGKQLQQGRLAIKAKHDELKADSLAYGKAVDLIQRIALAEIEPAEAHLKLQEKFAETQQKLRHEERINERTSKLAQYVEDPSIYNYGDMADDAFQMLLEQVKAAHDLQAEKAEAAANAMLAAEAKAEAERKAAAEADRIAREKAEAEAVELRKKNEAIQAKAKAEKAAADKKLADAQKKIDEAKKAEDDRIAAEKAEAYRKAEEERLEALRIAEEAKKAAAAPDKDKLLEWVGSMDIVEPLLSTPEAKKVAARITGHLLASILTYQKLIEEL